MDCPSVPLIKYSEFDKRLFNHYNERRIPVSGSIDVTERCNLKCAHCYINLSASDNQAIEKELRDKELIRITDQIVDEGCLFLLLTGGEPFLRRDFLSIYTYAKRKGLLVSIFTNGTSITPYVADYLAEWRPYSIEITLYGICQETYENVTGVTGSFDRCLRGIELLLERRLPLKLKTMVMTTNKHEIWDIKKYAEELNVDFRFDPVLNMRLDGSRRPGDFRLSIRDVVALDLADEKRMKAWREFCEKFFYPPSDPEYLYQCGAGLNSFHIDAYGKLSVCLMSRSPEFDLRSNDFSVGWNEFIPEILSQRWTRDSICKDCRLFAMCGQCPGWAQIEHGERQQPVEYLCEIAQHRAEVFGLKYNYAGGKR
jgi:radical SAM protein with 4Fe4S-binding SPASM domain